MQIELHIPNEVIIYDVHEANSLDLVQNFEVRVELKQRLAKHYVEELKKSLVHLDGQFTIYLKEQSKANLKTIA